MSKAIGVQFQTKGDPNSFSGQEYTYYSEDDRRLGEILKVPTKRGSRTARVVRIYLDDEAVNTTFEITTIPAGYGIEPEVIDRNIAQVWNYLEESTPDATAQELMTLTEDATGFDEDIIANALYQVNRKGN